MKNQQEYRKYLTSIFIVSLIKYHLQSIFFIYLFLDAPKLLTNVRTFTGSRNIDVLLQCSSIANPPAAIFWLDENKQEIDNPQHYKIKTINQSSTLSFSIVGDRHFIEKKNHRKFSYFSFHKNIHPLFFIVEVIIR
jgi:hypothetical protein